MEENQTLKSELRRVLHVVPLATYTLLKTGSLYNAIPRDFIGLAAMVYEPLHHAGEIEINCLLVVLMTSKVKSARSRNILDCF